MNHIRLFWQTILILFALAPSLTAQAQVCDSSPWGVIEQMSPGGGTFTGTVLIKPGALSDPGIGFSNDPTTGLYSVRGSTQHGLGFLSHGVHVGYLSYEGYNNCLGDFACYNVVDGSLNTTLGSSTLTDANNTNRNTCIGSEACRKISTTGSKGYNTAVGAYALETASGANPRNCTAIGEEAIANPRAEAIGLVGVGFDVMYSPGAAYWDVAVGGYALYSLDTGANNIAIGLKAGYETASGEQGWATTTGSNSIYIGTSATNSSATQRDKAIAIGYNSKVNCSSCAAIGGVGSDAVKVGIGTDTPTTELHVVGSGRFDGGSLVNGAFSLTADGGLAVKTYAGGTITRGQIVCAHSTDDQVVVCPTSSVLPIGVAYNSSTTGKPVWVVTSGTAYVLPLAATTATRGQHILTSATTAGYADQSATPTLGRVVGIWAKSGSGNGAITLARIVPR